MSAASSIAPARFAVTPFHAALGAEIGGFPLGSATPDDFAALCAALRRHLVLRLRGTALTDAPHVALSRQFRAFGGGDADAPPSRIWRITNLKNPDGTPAGVLGDGEVTWHSDGWFYERPFAVSILRAEIVPPAGGNTHFSNTYAALDTLPQHLRRAIAGRAIHHQTVYAEGGELHIGRQHPPSPDMRTWAGVDHPMERLARGAERRCLYLGRRKLASIPDMPLDEGQALLDALWHHATRPDLIWTQVWQPGDLLIWDNRVVLHKRDPFDPGHRRLLHRTSEVGERPV